MPNPDVFYLTAEEYIAQTTVSTLVSKLTPNPQTKADFAQQAVTNFVKEVVKSHEVNKAERKARREAQAKADTDITL
jgi:hypothetical protein